MDHQPQQFFMLTREDEDAARGVCATRSRLRRLHNDLNFLNLGLPGLSKTDLSQDMVPFPTEFQEDLLSRRIQRRQRKSKLSDVDPERPFPRRSPRVRPISSLLPSYGVKFRCLSLILTSYPSYYSAT